jgi:hypothetical protein
MPPGVLRLELFYAEKASIHIRAFQENYTVAINDLHDFNPLLLRACIRV